jgi:hypothetical protein
MSDTTRTHRPTSKSPRYTKARGIGRDRVRWPSSQVGTYRHGMVLVRPGQTVTERFAEEGIVTDQPAAR